MLKKGFTLVELMIVVAIIGILAAIAIPNFMDMQYRAKRAEVPACVDGIKTAEMGYEAAFDKFIPESTSRPDTSPGKQQREWTPGSNTGNFDILGWAPDGEVRGMYKVTTEGSASGSGDFLITGEADVDGDGTQSQYTATKTINTTFNNNNDTY